jgi:hypothetical protein
MSVDYKKVLLGMLGEKIVAKHFRDNGHQVDESLNVFDSDKDMIIDGNNVEVKTNAPLIYFDSFSIPKGQYNKIMNSHRVYWVSVPLQTKDDQFSGCIFEMDPKIAKLHTITFNSGQTTIGLKRQQEGMKIIHRIEDRSLLNHLRDLSSSYL